MNEVSKKVEEFAVPQHDNFVLREIEWENRTAGGVIISDPGKDYNWLRTTEGSSRGYTADRDLPQDRRAVGRYEVLAVGPGTWIDVNDEVGNNVFMRKPMSAAVGDVVLAMNGPKPFPCNGEILHTCPDHMILATVHNHATKEEFIVPQNDYVFATESKYIHETSSGVAIVGAGHEGLDLPGYTSLPVRFKALGVGLGPWAIRHARGKPAEYARRPMCLKTGEEFSFGGAAFMAPIGGAVLWVVQDCQIEAVFKEAA